MNKEEFLVVLQVALFKFEGMKNSEIRKLFDFVNEKLVNIGIFWAESLKKMEINKEISWKCQNI